LSAVRIPPLGTNASISDFVRQARVSIGGNSIILALGGLISYFFAQQSKKQSQSDCLFSRLLTII